MRRVAIVLCFLAACGKKAPTAATATDATPAAQGAPGGDGADAAPEPAEDIPAAVTLHIWVPAPPAEGKPKGEVVIQFDGPTEELERYERVLLKAGDGPERDLTLGEPTSVPVPASDKQPLRLRLGAGDERVDVLVPVRAGDLVNFFDSDEGTWAASRYHAGQEASTAHMRCTKRGAQCDRGFYAVPNNDRYRKCGQYYCEEAPSVRLRGPWEGKATISPASPDAELGSPQETALGPAKLPAGEKATPVLVWASPGDSPKVVLGAAEAYLIVSPGEQWEVYLDKDGKVGAAMP